MPGSVVADIRNSFGAAFIGQLVSTTLFGLTIGQTWIYYWRYRNKDPTTLKFLIAFVTVMDGFHTILCSYAMYWYLVLNFGNVQNLEYSTWSMKLQLIISLFIGASVQFYYTRRVYVLSKSIICPIVIVALVVIDSAFGILFTEKEIVLKRFSSVRSLKWVTGVGMSARALADLLIAAAMCWSLYRKRTGFERTDSIIMTLMAYSINSGLLTSLLSVGMTISSAVAPHTQICMAFYWVMSYVNSLLAMLNSRDYVRNRLATDDTPDNAFNMSSIRIEPLSDAYGSKSGQHGVSVTVHRSVTLDLGRNKSDYDVEPTFEISKPDANILPLQGRGNIVVERVGS